MVVEIPLPDWEPQTWICLSVGFWLGLSYLVVGPLLSRYEWRKELEECPQAADPALPLFLWLCSPALIFPLLLYPLRRPFFWLVYGSSK